MIKSLLWVTKVNKCLIGYQGDRESFGGYHGDQQYQTPQGGNQGDWILGDEVQGEWGQHSFNGKCEVHQAIGPRFIQLYLWIFLWRKKSCSIKNKKYFHVSFWCSFWWDWSGVSNITPQRALISAQSPKLSRKQWCTAAVRPQEGETSYIVHCKKKPVEEWKKGTGNFRLGHL